MPGSCLMIGLQSVSLTKEEKDFIVSNNIAGVVLLKKNIKSFQQTYELCSELKSLTKPSPLIAIDMEGGEVNRFSHLKESHPWPSPKILSKFKPNHIFSIAKAMAGQLHVLGIDINFAPVVDLLLVEDNPLLKNRIFGESKEDILKCASHFMEGLIEGKLIPCLKHFPGHGGVSEDSHKTLPKDNRELKDLEPQLEIFQTLFEKSPCWIMTAHVEFSNIDKKPATFSKTFLKTELRTKRNFKGLLVSDDIDMGALEDFSSGECFFHALKGGCDLVIACQKKESPQEIIKYFKQNPDKKEELKKELKCSSNKILEIRQKTFEPLPDFNSVKKELSKLQIRELFSHLGLIYAHLV